MYRNTMCLPFCDDLYFYSILCLLKKFVNKHTDLESFINIFDLPSANIIQHHSKPGTEPLLHMAKLIPFSFLSASPLPLVKL